MSRRPKVLFLTPWYPTAGAPANGTFVREHALAASRNADVLVLHIDRAVRSLRASLRRETEASLTRGITTFRLVLPRPVPRAGYFTALPAALWAFKSLARGGFKPEVIHAHVCEASVLAVVLGQLTRTPVVATEHFSGFATGSLKYPSLVAAKWAFTRADRVLPVSDFLRRSMMALGVHAQLEVVPNTVDLDAFYPASRTVEQGQSQLLFVGDLGANDEKGLSTLLAALNELADERWYLRVVGDGVSRAEHEQRVASSPFLSERVDFLGVRPPAEMPGIYRGSDLLVLPSRMETFGCVVMEAQASGVPVLASNVGGVPEVFTPGGGWLVPPERPRDLRIALADFLAGAEVSRGHSLARSMNRYGHERVGHHLVRIYRDVILGNRDDETTEPHSYRFRLNHSRSANG